MLPINACRPYNGNRHNDVPGSCCSVRRAHVHHSGRAHGARYLAHPLEEALNRFYAVAGA